MKEAAITFNNVSKSYPRYHHITGGLKNFLFHMPKALSNTKSSRFEALKNISFEIRKGESFGIIGKNGAGKSTILGLMAGVLKPSSGTLTVNGRVSPLLELGAGFHHELTGRENIVLNGVLLGLTRNEVLAKMDEIIDFSELGEFIEEPIRTYSSGMYARLGFSIVSSLDPEILLIDEILGVGDMYFQEKCKVRMMEFKKKGVTMVFVSHSMEEVSNICDRVALIENHTLTLKDVGTPASVIAKYTRSSKEVFSEVYEKNLWKTGESKSGPGSELNQTREIIRELPEVLKELEITTMLDLPCGDFNWMKHVDLGVIKYIGSDIVDELILDNKKKYGNGNREFVSLDLLTGDIPKVDLLFCRDHLVHLSFRDIKTAFRNIKKSTIKYIMTTTFTRHETNIDIATGEWRTLNLEKPPFNLPNPIKIINEKCTEGNGEFADKSLGVWLVEDLKLCSI